jgi:glycosyltransferase involved in cell wall biosynthesis
LNVDITYLSSSLIPSRAANSIHVMKMCQALAALGNRVVLYARQGDPTGIGADDFAHYGVERCFRIVKCPRSRFQKFTGDLLYARQVASQVARRPKPELFFARHIYSLARVAHSGVPIVFEAHTPPVNILQKWVEGAVYRRGNFSRLVVISHALAGEYRRLFPWLTEDKILVAPDAADPPGSIRSQPKSVSPPLVEWTARSGCLQAGYVGHLYAGRGVDLIAAVARRLPEMDFHLVGGAEKDITRCKQTCSEANVHFHGYLPHAALSAVYDFPAGCRHLRFSNTWPPGRPLPALTCRCSAKCLPTGSTPGSSRLRTSAPGL